jgi:Zn-dependent alcohol dehydrogenase
MILVGQPPVNTRIIFENARQHYCGKTILDSQGGLTDPNVDIPRYIKLYKAGRLKLTGFIDQMSSLENINEAIDRVSSCVGRVTLYME